MAGSTERQGRFGHAAGCPMGTDLLFVSLGGVGLGSRCSCGTGATSPCGDLPPL